MEDEKDNREIASERALCEEVTLQGPGEHFYTQFVS